MKTEFIRKFFHLFFGIFFLILIYFLGTETSFLIILSLFLLGLITALIIKKGYKNKTIDYLLEIVERDHEKHFPGKAALLFFLSVLMLLYFFRMDKLIVIASLSTLIFADSFAAIIGKSFGKHFILNNKHYSKTIEGTITCFIVSFFVLSLFSPINIAFLVALIATLIEFLPINDNLAMPLSIAILLKLLI
jgi:phytol kinase